MVEYEDLGIGTGCLALGLGILSRAFLSKYLLLPYTVLLLLFGLIIGVIIVAAHPEENIFTNSISNGSECKATQTCIVLWQFHGVLTLIPRTRTFCPMPREEESE